MSSLRRPHYIFVCLSSLLVLGVSSQNDPVLTLVDFTSSSGDAQCAVHGEHTVMVEATLDVTGVQSPAAWTHNGVEFRTEADQLLCTASLDVCPPPQLSQCYCKSHNVANNVYVVVYQPMADSSLSGLSILARTSRPQLRMLVDTDKKPFPHVSQNLNIAMSMTTDSNQETYTPPANNSAVEYRGDNPEVTFIVNGLSRPFQFVFLKRGHSIGLNVVSNQSMFTYQLGSAGSHRIKFTYEENDFCQRKGDYFINIDEYEDSNDLSRGEIVAIAFGAFIFVFIIAFIIVCCTIGCSGQKEKSQEKKPKSSTVRGRANDYTTGRSAVEGSQTSVINPVYSQDDGFGPRNQGSIMKTQSSFVRMGSGREVPIYDEPIPKEPVVIQQGPYISIIRTSVMY